MSLRCFFGLHRWGYWSFAYVRVARLGRDERTVVGAALIPIEERVCRRCLKVQRRRKPPL